MCHQHRGRWRHAWASAHTDFDVTGTSTKPVPVQQLRIVYSKYGTRNNRVKSLMWATRNRVHMLSPSILLPLYYDIPVSAKRLQRARTEKAPGEGARWERQGRDKDRHCLLYTSDAADE